MRARELIAALRMLQPEDEGVAVAAGGALHDVGIVDLDGDVITLGIELWRPIETAKTAPYEKVDVWATNRKTGRGRRHANAYRSGNHWLDTEGHFIAGKAYRDRDGEDCFDPDATDEQSTIVTHWMPVPEGPAV